MFFVHHKCYRDLNTTLGLSTIKNVLLSFAEWKTVIEKLILVILNLQVYFLP